MKLKEFSKELNEIILENEIMKLKLKSIEEISDSIGSYIGITPHYATILSKLSKIKTIINQ